MASMSRGPQVTLLVACSNTKTSKIEPALQARYLQSESLEGRVEEWTTRLADTKTSTSAARDLYAGDHWATMKNLVEDLRPNQSISLKVLSAGYGLVDSETPIKPYSASFTPRSADLVAPGHVSAKWWALVNDSPHLGSEPRTIRGIATDVPESVFVIVASEHYLRAVAPDLQLAAERLNSPTQILIFSAGSPMNRELDAHMLRFDSRLRRLVGGSNVSLNARVASHVLRTTPPEALNHASISVKLDRISANLAPIEQSVRKTLTDGEVLEFISEELVASPSTSATRSLRNLRDRGFACEQSRFHELFRKAIDATD